jgi:hypothetical protein
MATTVMGDSQESMGAGEVDQVMGEGSQTEKEVENIDCMMGEEEQTEAEVLEGSCDEVQEKLLPGCCNQEVHEGKNPSEKIQV